MLRTQIPGFFKERRERLIKKAPGGVFIFPANEHFVRNPDVTYPFRQESNFYYLSGFEEPESFLVISANKSTPGASKMVLFVRKRDLEKEMWEGERHGVEGAQKVFGADEAFTTDEFDRKLPELLQGSEQVYYRMGHSETMDRRILSGIDAYRRSMGRTGKALSPVRDPNEVVGEMRLFKSPEEVTAMRKACQITANAHKLLMKEVRPGMNEAEVEALVDYTFRRNGCQRVGYGSIIAGGKNATCLHYTSNNEPLRDGDLLLVDAGGEFDYYTSDITRTFPVGKRFSEAQAKAYSLVLKSQKEAVAMAKPGAKLPDIHKRVCEILVDGMLSLGLLQGKTDEIVKNAGFKRFYPHNTSHWLGIDVHDVGLYVNGSEPRALEPGMVFTIEPGFYVQPSDKEAPVSFRDIGIRIEDDILITAGGNENLTKDAPKEIADIEALKA